MKINKNNRISSRHRKKAINITDHSKCCKSYGIHKVAQAQDTISVNHTTSWSYLSRPEGGVPSTHGGQDGERISS